MREELFTKFVKHISFGDKVVLDAGSGRNSLGFLLSQAPKEITSASIDDVEVTRNKVFYSSVKLPTRIEFLQVDLSQKDTCKTNYYDICFCDFFFAGVEGRTPFKSIVVAQNLAKCLKSGGYLCVTGFEFPINLSPDTEAINELYQFKDALDLIIGHTPYREPPLSYINEIMVTLGVNVVHEEKVARKYTSTARDWLCETYSESILKKIADIDGKSPLSIGLKYELDYRVQRVREIKTHGLRFGNYFIGIYKT